MSIAKVTNFNSCIPVKTFIKSYLFHRTEDGTSTEKAPFLEPSVEVGPPFPSTKSEKAAEEQEPEDK